MGSHPRHLIDPTYFDDALAQFDDEYTVYVAGDLIIDDYGNQKRNFTSYQIRGSLQSKGKSINKNSTGGNTYTWRFEFYCKSCYPLDIGDYIYARDVLLIVTRVTDLDEFGVRSCELNMTNLAATKDLEDFIKYQDGRQQR